MAAATDHIPFLVFLLFLTSSSLRTTHARIPNLFHRTTHFNVATEDTQDPSIPKQEEDNRHRAITSASQNPKVRDVGGGLYGYSDPEKNSRKTSTYYNADAYELYDEEPLKGSPIGTNYNTEGEEEVYHAEAITEKKPLPYRTTSNYYYYGTSGSSEKWELPRSQADTDNQYSFVISDTQQQEQEQQGEPRDGFTP